MPQIRLKEGEELHHPQKPDSYLHNIECNKCGTKETPRWHCKVNNGSYIDRCDRCYLLHGFS